MALLLIDEKCIREPNSLELQGKCLEQNNTNRVSHTLSLYYSTHF